MYGLLATIAIAGVSWTRWLVISLSGYCAICLGFAANRIADKSGFGANLISLISIVGLLLATAGILCLRNVESYRHHQHRRRRWRDSEVFASDMANLANVAAVVAWTLYLASMIVCGIDGRIGNIVGWGNFVFSVLNAISHAKLWPALILVLSLIHI